MSETEPIDKFRKYLLAARALPVAFIGSGVSMRYISSPDWDGLLDHFASKCGRTLGYYRSKSDIHDRDKRPDVARMIADDFHRIWWDNPEFSASRQAFGERCREKSDPLKFEVARLISSLAYTDDTSLLAELDLLSKIHVHAVITTNWDTIIEDHLSGYETFVGQDNILFANTYSVGEVYKIHGSKEDPFSLVLTEDDYNRFQNRNPYLIAKLLTMFAEHPIIFLGYSANDPHIQRILLELASCLPPERLSELNDRLFFVGRVGKSRGAGLIRSRQSFGDRTIDAFEFGINDFGKLFEMLAGLPEHYPVKLLRRLRRDVYNLAYSSDPQRTIHVLPFDASKDLDKVETVIGVGLQSALAQNGYLGLSRIELVRDMLSGKIEHDADILVNQVIPRIFKSADYSPIYYPMYLNGDLGSDGNPCDGAAALPQKARDLILGNKPLLCRHRSDLSVRNGQPFGDMIEAGDLTAERYGIVASFDVEDIVKLQSYLIRQFATKENPSTELWVLGCKYDRLVFGPEMGERRAEVHALLGLTAT